MPNPVRRSCRCRRAVRRAVVRRRCPAAPVVPRSAAAPNHPAPVPPRSISRRARPWKLGTVVQPVRPARRRSATRTPPFARRTAAPASRRRPRSGCPSPQATPRRRDQRPRRGPCAPAPAPQWAPRRPGAPRWSRAACARTTGRDDRPHAGMPRQSSRSRQVRSVQRFHPRTPSYRRFRSHYTVAVLSSGLSQGDFWCCAVMPQVRCGPPMPVRR